MPHIRWHTRGRIYLNAFLKIHTGHKCVPLGWNGPNNQSIARYSQSKPARSLHNMFKQAMSGIPASGLNGTELGEPRGLTVSSVTSLSVNPLPMLSFNLQVPSRTSQVLHEREIFALNVLPATEDSVRLCRAFSGALGHDVNPFETEKEFLNLGGILRRGRYPLNDKHEISAASRKHPRGTEDIPTISTALAVLYCKKQQVYTVQDHEIWVAQVYHVELGHESNLSGNLLYQSRCFHSLGPRIK